MRLLIGFFIVSIFSSCEYLADQESIDVVARVGDSYLYKEDIKGVVTDDVADSAALVEIYIDNWIKKELLLQKAYLNLSADLIDFEEQLKAYENSLVIYAYENQLINQKLDTSVSVDRILEYYKSNKSNFKLRENLYQVVFTKILNSAPNKDSLEQWIFSEEDYYIELSNYCRQFASNCHIDTSLWLLSSDLLSYLPQSAEYDLEATNQIIADTTCLVYIRKYDSRKKGDIAPVAYVKEEIIDIIRNKRKLKLLSSVREEIFEEATLRKKYEIYN